MIGTMVTALQIVLERDWTPHASSPRWRNHMETFRGVEIGFYGSSVAEGICPCLHDHEDLNADGSADRLPRRLHPVGSGWLECAECKARWRFRNLVGVGDGEAR